MNPADSGDRRADQDQETHDSRAIEHGRILLTGRVSSSTGCVGGSMTGAGPGSVEVGTVVVTGASGNSDQSSPGAGGA